MKTFTFFIISMVSFASFATEIENKYSVPETYEVEEVVVSPWYVSPSLVYVKSDKNRSSDNDFGFRFGVGKVLNEKINVEGFVTENDLSKFNQVGGGVESQYFFTRNMTLNPYWVLGAGALKTKINNSNETNPMFETGFGVVSKLNDVFAVKADLRYRVDSDESNIVGHDHFGDYVANVGVIFNLSSKRVVTKTSSFVAEEPKAEEVVAMPLVDMDLDKDGVVNASDLCPNTPKGFNVNSDGCVIEGVLFDFDSYKLNTKSKQVLDNVVVVLKNNPDIVVEIEVEGHTDSTGSLKYNDKLSMRRANAVKSYLIDNGISKDNISVKAFGETSPVESNSSKSGRAMNRRAVVKVLN